MATVAWLMHRLSKMDHDPERRQLYRHVLVAAHVVSLALAVFLAVREFETLPSLSAKAALLTIAVLYPDLFVLVQWVTTSMQGVSLLSNTPLGIYLPPSAAPTALAPASSLASSSPSFKSLLP